MGVMMAIMLVCVVLGSLVGCAKGIPRSKSTDDHFLGFWVSPNEQGRQIVSLTTGRGEEVRCVFDYDTFPMRETSAKEAEKSPQEIMGRVIASHPCLTIQNDHSYRLCLGINATQIVGGQADGEPILLGTYSGWTEAGEQEYKGGSREHCTTPRTFNVQFACDKKLHIISATEPSTCNYHFVVGAPEACGHKVFTRSYGTTSVETWYMEAFEAHDEAIGCVVHAAGFGVASPIHSTTIKDFTLRVEKNKKPADVTSYEARFGQRETYTKEEVHVVDGTDLRPRKLPLRSSPNYLAITIEP